MNVIEPTSAKCTVYETSQKMNEMKPRIMKKTPKMIPCPFSQFGTRNSDQSLIIIPSNKYLRSKSTKKSATDEFVTLPVSRFADYKNGKCRKMPKKAKNVKRSNDKMNNFDKFVPESKIKSHAMFLKENILSHPRPMNNPLYSGLSSDRSLRPKKATDKRSL